MTRSLSVFVLVALLAGPIRAQNHYLLSWSEGDLDGDGVPERVLLVSPESADPGHSESRKFLMVMQYRDGRYEKVLTWPVPPPVAFQTRLWERHTDPRADFWGLSFHPAELGRDPYFRLTFTPGSGEFVQVIWRDGRPLVEGSGDQ